MTDHPEQALRTLDAELAATVERLQRIRTELTSSQATPVDGAGFPANLTPRGRGARGRIHPHCEQARGPRVPGVGEVKRMHVAPDFRGLHVGSRLLDCLLGQAAQRGMSTVRLDTARFMVDAQRLYRSRGFAERSPYPQTEIPQRLHDYWIFFELRTGGLVDKGVDDIVDARIRLGGNLTGHGSPAEQPQFRPDPTGRPSCSTSAAYGAAAMESIPARRALPASRAGCSTNSAQSCSARWRTGERGRTPFRRSGR